MNKRKIGIVIIAACAALIIYELVRIIMDMSEYRAAQLEYESIRDRYITEYSDATGSDVFEPIDYPRIKIDFDELAATNSDVTCWLYFPALDISYPVVKENEINEYLYKTFDGDDNKAGCLFEDVLSSADFTGMHDMIFGHNMKDGSMFGKLKTLYKAGNENVLDDNPYIYIYTKDMVYQYEIFAYYQTTRGSEAYREVNSNEEYDSLIDYIFSHNSIETPSDVDFGKRASILTLSTCSGASGGESRFVVHTVKTNSWSVS